jgi:hypothetical protein
LSTKFEINIFSSLSSFNFVAKKRSLIPLAMERKIEREREEGERRQRGVIGREERGILNTI